jgi:hypothetical protein
MSAGHASDIVRLIVTQAAQRRKGASMTAALAFSYPRTELAVREQDGASVSLFWTRATNVLVVEVIDHRNGHSFEFELEPDEPPLDRLRSRVARTPAMDGVASMPRLQGAERAASSRTRAQ